MQTNLKCFYLQCSRPVPERHPVCVEFLPLNYLTNVLAEIESQGNFNSVLWKTGNCYPFMFTHCYKTLVMSERVGLDFLLIEIIRMLPHCVYSHSESSVLNAVAKLAYRVVVAVILCLNGEKGLYITYTVW